MNLVPKIINMHCPRSYYQIYKVDHQNEIKSWWSLRSRGGTKRKRWLRGTCGIIHLRKILAIACQKYYEGQLESTSLWLIHFYAP